MNRVEFGGAVAKETARTAWATTRRFETSKKDIGHGVTKEAQTQAASQLDIDVFRIPYVGSGSAPTYLLLHGLGLSHREFTGLARILSKTGHVVSFDLPGFGLTQKPNRALTVEDHATVIKQKLVALPVGPVIAVGHSMGAQFAVELARQDPDAVSHVALIGPVVDAERRTLIAQGWGLLLDGPREPLATQVMVLHSYLRCGVLWFLKTAKAMRDYPTHLRIADLVQPLLVIRGERDPIAKAQWCDWLSRQVPGGYLVTVPGRHHNVAHSDPAAIAAAILTFEAARH